MSLAALDALSLSDLPSGRFKEYQDLFPPSDTHRSNLCLQHGMRNFITDKLVRKDPLCWQAEDIVWARKRGDGAGQAVLM